MLPSPVVARVSLLLERPLLYPVEGRSRSVIICKEMSIMVATIEAERTVTKEENKVWKAISALSGVGALVALVWLGVVTSNLSEMRAKLDKVETTANTTQFQLNEVSQRMRGHETSQSMNAMPQAAPSGTGAPMQGMQGMQGMGTQSMQPPAGSGNAPTQPQTGGQGMGGM